MVLDLDSGYQGRDVLVTGADGFIGSHLVDRLVASGARTRAHVHATSSGQLHNLAHVHNRLHVSRGDLTDKHSTDRLISALNRETSGLIIFHLAAQAHVGESWERPYQTIETNVIGTLNLLQSIVDVGVPLFKFVTAGTSEEYGNAGRNLGQPLGDGRGEVPALDERSPIAPRSIYATSKVASSFLTMNFYHAYGVPAVVSRMFNNYGPRQSPRFITGEIITQALRRNTIELGASNPSRDFCYCEDGARGLMAIGLDGRPGDVYVHGQGRSITVAAWAEMIVRIGQDQGYWGPKEVVQVSERLRPGTSEVSSLRADYGKMYGTLGWELLVTWEDGLRRTISWYAENLDDWDRRVTWQVPDLGTSTL